jgi:hypothetical protein
MPKTAHRPIQHAPFPRYRRRLWQWLIQKSKGDGVAVNALFQHEGEWFSLNLY